MFFKRKKTNDKQARFQKITFTNRLKDAREYKRETRHAPSQVGIFLRKLGLGSFITYAVVLFAIGVLSYLFIFKNIFTLTEIKVSGAEGEIADRIEAEVAAVYKGKYLGLFPKANALILRTDSVRQVILDSEPNVRDVVLVKRLWPDKLEVKVIPRRYSFYVFYPGQVWKAYQDGVLHEPLVDMLEFGKGVEKDILSIRINKKQEPKPKDLFISSVESEELLRMRAALLNQVQMDVLGVSLVSGDVGQAFSTSTPSIEEKLNPSDSVFYVKTNDAPIFGILFDTHTDTALAINKLKLLWLQMPNERKKSLNYIDMRLEERSFVCLVNTPCVKILNISTQ